MNKENRSEKWVQRDNSTQIRKEDGKLESSFGNDLELIEESQEYDTNLDSASKKCMACPEMFMDWSDLSDHMRKVHKLYLEDELMLVICGPKRGVLVVPEVRVLHARASSTLIAGWP